MKFAISLLATFLLVILLYSPVALAAERSGVNMPDTVTLDGVPLFLNGMALRSVFIFDIYIAGLYLPKLSSDAEAILQADTQRRTVMHFVRDVDAEDLRKGWQKGLEKNTPKASDTLKAEFDALCHLMRSIKDDEEMIFNYIPTVGTEVIIVDETVGLIAGKEFADALWRCWLGPNPDPGKKFKNDLLGQHEPSQ